MGRLIDADELIDILGFEDTQEERDENVGEIITLEDIDRIPTAYDPDKVVEQLKDRSTLSRPVGWTRSYEIITLKDAVETVKGGGVDGN